MSRGGHSVFMAGAVALLILPFSTFGAWGVEGQTPEVPTGEQQPKTGAPPPPSASEDAPAEPTWAVNCSNTKAGLDCRVTQSVFLKRTRQRFLSVAVRVPPKTKTPMLLIQVPLGTYLPAGVSLQFGEDAAWTLPFQNCNRAGCVAEYAVTEAEIAAMQKGTDLTVTIQNLQKQPVKLTVPATGFAEAYAKIK